MLIFTVEVDVAIARPPSPANTRTVFHEIGIDAEVDDSRADVEAQLIACQMAANIPGVVMPIASRITSLVL